MKFELWNDDVAPEGWRYEAFIAFNLSDSGFQQFPTSLHFSCLTFDFCYIYYFELWCNCYGESEAVFLFWPAAEAVWSKKVAEAVWSKKVAAAAELLGLIESLPYFVLRTTFGGTKKSTRFGCYYLEALPIRIRKRAKSKFSSDSLLRYMIN